MFELRNSFWFRFSCVIAFATASLLGSTHFHFSELQSVESGFSAAVASDSCACVTHSQSTTDQEDGSSDEDSPSDSEHCPICKLLAEMAGEVPVADGTILSDQVCFGTFFDTLSNPIAASTFYFGRGPPAGC